MRDWRARAAAAGRAHTRALPNFRSRSSGGGGGRPRLLIVAALHLCPGSRRARARVRAYTCSVPGQLASARARPPDRNTIRNGEGVKE